MCPEVSVPKPFAPDECRLGRKDAKGSSDYPSTGKQETPYLEAMSKDLNPEQRVIFGELLSNWQKASSPKEKGGLEDQIREFLAEEGIEWTMEDVLEALEAGAERDHVDTTEETEDPTMDLGDDEQETGIKDASGRVKRFN